MSYRSKAFFIASLCVLSAAGAIAGELPPAPGAVSAAAEHTGLDAATVAGRWHSDRVWMLAARDGGSCEDGSCGLTLDVVACGDSWCGIEVGKGNVCGATALRFDGTKTRETEAKDAVLFAGTLELARGTEPYVVEAYLRPAAEGAPAELSITGDTGGEFRYFRRSFPFHATLARAGEATCRLEKPVS